VIPLGTWLYTSIHQLPPRDTKKKGWTT